jgi:OOP family OmpA-OmpF porin
MKAFFKKISSLKWAVQLFFPGVLCVPFFSHAQISKKIENPAYNRWSLELLGGFSNAVGPYSSGYYTNLLNLSNVQLGTRYMANRHVGLKLDAEYDLFKNNTSGKGKQSLPFRTNYYRFSLQGVANLHHVFDFQEWTKHIGVQIHAGAGYSTMGNDSLSAFSKGRNMIHVIGGISPFFKINDRFTLKLDVSALKHMHRKYTIDMKESRNERGMDAFVGTFTLGLQINLGKAKVHADWLFDKPADPSGNMELQELKNRLEKLERMHDDDDRDGVLNYLDKELSTPAGSQVDAAGVALVDSDSDGVTDAVDKCPGEYGLPALEGCPDKDSDQDGILDYRDQCPSVKGLAESNGCPKIERAEQEIVNTAFSDLQFEYNKASILSQSYQSLDGLAVLLNQKPEWKLRISGHTDSIGDEEGNLNLSKERAESVKNYLVKKGIASERIETRYYGSAKPITSNETEEGRQKNRRVELEITF